MLGFSTDQLLVILGICSATMKPSDMVKIARTVGRMTGRAVRRLIVARRQLDEILGQSAATKVHMELKEVMAQLDSICYEVQNLSRLTPGQFMMKQHNIGMTEVGKSDSSDGSAPKQAGGCQEIRSIIRDEIENRFRSRPIQNFGNFNVSLSSYKYSFIFFLAVCQYCIFPEPTVCQYTWLIIFTTISLSTTEARKLDVVDESITLKSMLKMLDYFQAAQVSELEGHEGDVATVVVAAAPLVQATATAKLASYCWTAGLDRVLIYWDFFRGGDAEGPGWAPRPLHGKLNQLPPQFCCSGHHWCRAPLHSSLWKIRVSWQVNQKRGVGR